MEFIFSRQKKGKMMGDFLLIVFALIFFFWIILFGIIGVCYFFDRPAERCYGVDIVHKRGAPCGASGVGMGKSRKRVNCKKCLDGEVD
jgi:hypothetical protein